jgi:predicted DNA-binding transcriptional regulator YafY
VRADGEKSARTADPLGLVVKGTTWYLVANTAKGMRTFRISRMAAVTVLAAGFKRPARFDLAGHWSRSAESLQRQRGRYPVTLLLAEDRARRLAAHCKVTRVEDKQSMADPGWLALRADFDDIDQARFVVMGFGTQACVIDPPELRQQIRSEVAELAATME